MPGLSQLKKLSEDVLKLGDEPKLRAERGEKPVVAKIPSTIADIDDSEDFVLGMPEKPQEEVPEENPENQNEEEALAQASKDLDAMLAGNDSQQSAAPVEPDLSGLLNPMADDVEGVPDLSAFEEPPEPPKKKEPSIADMDLDALLSMPSEDFSEPEPVEDTAEDVETPAEEYKAPQGPDIFADISAAQMAENTASDEAVEDLDFAEPLPEDDFNVPEISEAAEEIPDAEELSDSVEDEADDEFAYSGESIDMTEDLPDELKEVPGDAFKDKIARAKTTSEDEAEPDAIDVPAGDAGFDAGDDFSMPDMSSADFEGDAADEQVTDEIPTSGDFGFDPIDTSGLDDFGSMGDITDAMASPDDAASFDLDSSMESDFSMADTPAAGDENDFDPASLDLSGLNLGDEDDGADAAGFDENAAPEVFDTSEMEGVDFNIQDTDSQLSSGSDFELDSAGAGEPDFEIAGYTGADANPFDKSGRIKSQILEPEPEEKRKNTLTDAEYKRFRENLNSYPLNVRIAVEDLIVKNEFTDDVVFEVIEKILKKVPARQLASHLEKMLDISLSVPRDFEKRTADEYEAYKKSLKYQLKNRIIPAAIIGIFIFLVGFCSVYLGKEFIYEPIVAENLYKEGYALLEQGYYPDSLDKFNSALKHKTKKKWFFRYAEGYREHNCYDYARDMYRSILANFDHDKQGGLDYVHMELDDLANYQEAERVLRRDVLDYHVNDKDALLLLGDIYLEWATEDQDKARILKEKNVRQFEEAAQAYNEKFNMAYGQYLSLCQQYGSKDEYLSRMMRFHVRTDKLDEVLADKAYFYPNEKSLEAKDWTEMSGYLMDKLYGELRADEEYLRSSIEDVLSMLNRAVEQDPSDPISRYNLSRYYIMSGNHDYTESTLKTTLRLFEESRHMKKRDTYKMLDTYRLLGEEYIYNRDYILAKESLSEGITLFTEKNTESKNFESDANIGKMYADMGDIEYFISGDLGRAEFNYNFAVNNKNDNPSLRYRLGYINYRNQNYDAANENFDIALRNKINDRNLMLASANTHALKNLNDVSSGKYEILMSVLENDIEKKDILLPQVNEEDTAIVETYLKAANNLGVVQFRNARQYGDSAANGKSIVNFQKSLRAWDALTRDKTSLVRLGGTNLAEQNIKYVTSPITTFEPAIYTDIPRILEDEKPLE